MMEKFFNPKSVAIIGASHTPGKIGYSILENFVSGGYKGEVYPVNPDTTPILNKKVYPSLKQIPEKIDLVVIAVPAAFVPKVLKECIQKKIESIIIISAGFSENGKNGKLLENRCKKIISRTKTRVIGPNCIGVYDPYTATDTLFLSRERLGRPKQGNIAFITQSGAVGSTILDWLSEEKIGVSKFVSYGNAMDVNETDILEFLSKDENTKVIVFYLEGVASDGRKFIEIAKKTTMNKPVIILKAGKTEKGTKAVVSHTGSLAGSAEIYSSVFKQSGVIEAGSWQELFDFAKIFSQPLPKGRKVAIVTDGGGFGVLAADECERQGLQLQEPNDELKDKLKKEMPSYVSLHNPIDLTGDANSDRYALAIEECLKEYDAVVVITLFQVPTLEEKVVDVIIDLSKKYKKPVLCCAAGGKFTKKLIAILEANSMPVYSTPEQAIKSLAVMVKYSEWLKKQGK